MHARVGFVEIPARTFDQGIKIMLTQALPSVRLLEGFRGAVLVGDRESGKAFYLTFWASEADMRRSEDAGAELRRDWIEALGLDDIPVERYEVFHAEIGGAEAS